MKRILHGLVVATLITSATTGATVPFTENFDANNANWRNADSLAANWSATGGPDGSSHLGTSANFENQAPNATVALFRAHDSFDSSSDAFVGDWESEGITEFSVAVRHSAPEPLTFFTRFASPVNFPGAAIVEFVPVAPHQWTTLTFAINDSNPAMVFEGPFSFSDVFSSIGNVQIGAIVSDTLAGQDLTFSVDLDQASIVPEPSSLLLGTFIAGLPGCSRRRRA